MFLLPGDSPIGYRLPLDTLPWADEETIEQETEADPFAPCAPLPPHQVLRGVAAPIHGRGRRGVPSGAEEPPVVDCDEPDLVRTALCVEPRGGIIHVFFPPLYAAQDWLTLATAIEDTAEELGRKVVLEGYLPPRDPRPAAFLGHT